jgi:hypothetical protein
MKLKGMSGLMPAQNAADIWRAVSTVLNAEDISTDSRNAFICGYLAGLGYALDAGPEGVET